MMRKIKQFIVSATLMAIGTQTFAQVRICDLQVRLNSPSDNMELHANDTVWIEFTIVNNGPDSIMANDTLWFWDLNNVYPFVAGSNIPGNTTKDFTRNDLGYSIIAPTQIQQDSEVQFCIKLVNQSTLVPTPVITFEDNDTANNWSCVDVTLKSEDIPSTVFEFSNELQEQLNFYPNPASTEVLVGTSLIKEEKVIMVIKDIAGREVGRKDYDTISSKNTNLLRLNTSGLNEGIYIIELNTGSRKAVGKVLIQH